MQIGTVSGLWFCRRSRRLKINIRWTLVHIRKSHVRANNVDVQETDFSFTVLQKLKLFLSMQVYAWMEFQLLISGIRLQKCFNSSPNQLNNTKDQVRGNSSRNTTSNKHTQNQTKVPTQHDNFFTWTMLTVSRRTRGFPDLVRCCTFLRITKPWLRMIIIGRNPTMRHVFRTHRVALDWLFDRVYPDTKIQIKYVDSKHQLADILTKGNFTRDERNNLLHLFIISHFSLLCCSQNFSLTSRTKNDAKRMQEQEGGNRIVAKPKPTTMKLVSPVSTKFFCCAKSACVEKPRDTQSTLSNLLVKYRKPDAKEYNQHAASSSQGWQKYAFLDVGTRKLVATEENQEYLNYPEDSVCTRKLVASGNSETEGSDKVWPHSLKISTNYLLHMEKVFSIVRQRYCLSRTDQMKILHVNTTIWGIYMSVTLQAAVHLGKDYTENLRSTKNQPKKSLRQLFQVTERLITEQTEITGHTTIDWQQPLWRETTLLTDRDVQFATAKTYVFSYSVICLGGISTENQSMHGKARLKWFLETRYFKDVDRIDGGPTEFEWKKFPGFTTLGILDEIQKMMTESKCEPEQLKGIIIFMSMYNDID